MGFRDEIVCGKKSNKNYYQNWENHKDLNYERSLKAVVDECHQSLVKDNLARIGKLKRMIAAYESLKLEGSEYYDREKHEEAKAELANLWKKMQGINEQESPSWGDYKKEELEKEKEEEEDNER